VINRLNVYPVPDGDTGTNMTLTVESVVEGLDGLGPDATMEEVGTVIAQASLMGARGNSGVILSQLLRGLVEAWRTVSEVAPKMLASSLEHADQLARQAVVRPVEGTILSVARAAAAGARAAGDNLTAMVRGARDRAKEALAKTPDQLPVLKQAGVVDSGGTGLLLLLDALCYVVAGDALPVAPALASITVHMPEGGAERPAIADLRYEVMYLLEAEDATVPAFREVWAGLGDSIVIIGGDGLFNCHIHTDDVGAAIEAGIDAGRPREIRVTDLADQVFEEMWVSGARADAAEEPEVEEVPTTAVVAVVVGDGVGRIFRSLGVRTLVKGGQSMNPSTADLVAAVNATGAGQVVILPNNKNIRPVAEQVDALVEASVRVVPTASLVEGFAALLAYDPDASAEENAAAMRESSTHVVAGEVTRAVRDAQTDAGAVHEGDWIGLGSGGVLAVADSLSLASDRLLATLVTPEHELVTIIEGEGSSPATTRRITDYLSEEYPGVTVEVHHGGQPLYPYLFGIE